MTDATGRELLGDEGSWPEVPDWETWLEGYMALHSVSSVVMADEMIMEVGVENPATWGKAENIVHDTYQEWWASRQAGNIGPSLARQVINALREAGLLNEDTRYVPEVPGVPAPPNSSHEH